MLSFVHRNEKNLTKKVANSVALNKIIIDLDIFTSKLNMMRKKIFCSFYIRTTCYCTIQCDQLFSDVNERTESLTCATVSSLLMVVIVNKI